MQARALPIAYVVCLGNAAQIGLAPLAEALLADDRVSALGLYVEGFDDAAAFAAVAETARRGGKGIVALKAGKSSAARQAAASHTAALAGDGAVSSAYMAQAGIAEVVTLPELVEALKILHIHGPLAGNRVCSLSCSGGEAALVADLAIGSALDFAQPSPVTAAALEVQLGPLVSIGNPLDYQTFIWGDAQRTAEVFATMLSDYDSGIFVIDPPRRDRCDPTSFMPALGAIEAAQQRSGRPAFAVASLPENFDEELAAAMMARGMVALLGLETALGALAAAATPIGRIGWRPWPGHSPRRVRLLAEDEAKARLASAGFAVPRGRSAPTLEVLQTYAASLVPPLVLKGLGFAHKSENSAVRLDLDNLSGQQEMPGARGYLVEEMVLDGRAEILVGLRRDPVYGLTVTLGLGGVTAELLNDSVTLVAPVVAADLRAAFGRLRLSPLLSGYRGRPRPDLEAAIDTALRLQAWMAAEPALEEVEINPLILRGTGAVAADAAIWEAQP